jgi:hypothetical protein
MLRDDRFIGSGAAQRRPLNFVVPDDGVPMITWERSARPQHVP